MKLPIKKKYFDQIKAGKKVLDYRDAHITFICEETGETLKRNVSYCEVHKICKLRETHPDIDWEDDKIIIFDLEDP